MPAVVSFKLKFIRQEERKTMTLRYNRAEAVRRTYAPQGFFGLFLADLENPEQYFTEVDLDSPFFREFSVMAEVPLDFERIGLASAQTAIDYGDPDDAANHKHGDFVFRPDDRGPKEFTVFLNESHDIDYAVTQQFHFDPDSGWDGESFSIEVPEERTEDRTLFVNPHEVLDFLEIGIEPGEIDAGVVASTDVSLRIQGLGGFDKQRNFVVLPDSERQVWRLRAPKAPEPGDRTLIYSLKHRLRDGTERDEGPIVLMSTSLVVHDPFPQALRIEFVPLFDSAAVRQLFIDVEYEDIANNYRRIERLDVPGMQTENVPLRLALVDPEQRTYRYRFTVIGTDGGFRRFAWEETNEEIVPIQL